MGPGWLRIPPAYVSLMGGSDHLHAARAGAAGGSAALIPSGPKCASKCAGAQIWGIESRSKGRPPKRWVATFVEPRPSAFAQLLGGSSRGTWPNPKPETQCGATVFWALQE